MKWQLGTSVELVGNTLPRALSLTTEAFLDRCIRWATNEESDAVADLTVAVVTTESDNCSVMTVANK
jgi:hypothetical protein